MDLLTSSLALGGANSSWGFNQSATSTRSGTGSVLNGPVVTSVGSSSVPATITVAPSATLVNLTSFVGNGSFVSLPTNTTSFANDTLCWLSYWSYTEAAASFTKSNRQASTTTLTRVSTISYTRPAVATSGNQSYTVLCDGLPRFDTQEEAQAAFQPLLLPTPLVTTAYITTTVMVAPTYSGILPQCSIKDAAACSNLWVLYASSRSRSLSTWSASNVLTISLAAPPTSVVVNGKTTSLPAGDGVFPVLTLHGTPYPPDKSLYSITNATSLTGRPIIMPGSQGTFTWNGNDITALAYGPRDQNCNGPPSGTIDSSQCAAAQCTIAATHVQLIYFPPPSKSRDLCANTSPGFDRFSVSTYSQPHIYTVINSTTFWQDKAYVRYSALSAYKTCSMDNLIQATTLPVGGVYTDQIVEVASSDISSICSWRMNPALHVEPIGATAFPFNFDDLNGPIPASAYTCIPQCLASCSSIVSEDFLSGLGLAVPTQIQKIDPAWASCVPYFLGVPDPPIALKGVGNFLSTTADPPSKPTQPAPGTSPEGVVTATNRPLPTSDPKPTSRPTPPANPNSPQSTKPPNNDPPTGLPETSRPSNQQSNNPPNDPPNVPNPTRNPITAPTLIIFTQTTTIPKPTNSAANNRPAAPIATIGDTPINVDPSNPTAIIVGDPSTPGSLTLSIGSPPLVISGTTISLSPTGGALVISGPTNLVPVGTVGGQTVWADASRPGVLLIGDPSSPETMQTLNVNDGVAVISGNTVSLAAFPTGDGGLSAVAMSIAGLSLVLDPASGTLEVSEMSILHPGDAQISLDGHAVFFEPGGQSVVIDGVRYPLAGLPLLVVGHEGVTSTVRLDGGGAGGSAAAEASETSSTRVNPTSTAETTNGGAPGETSKPGAAGRLAILYLLGSLVLLSVVLSA